ncbi:MAG TPA: hypothetical protein VMW12_10450 [Candidatus Dormibacteraeota bacterium]|nr:hypothetical protein [Candidatus Dormibacteraeota bacterium]
MKTRYQRLDPLAFGIAGACTALIMALFVALPMAGMGGYGAMGGWGGGHMGWGGGHMGWGGMPFGGAIFGWIGGALVAGLLAAVFAAIYNAISAAVNPLPRVDAAAEGTAPKP